MKHWFLIWFILQEEDRDLAVSGWYKLEQSFKALDISAAESQVIYQIVAAIIHLSSAGVQKGMTPPPPPNQN